MKKLLSAADLFCGAGGFTTGAASTGKVNVVLAINHWRTAIYTHQQNHPGTRHLCARIEHVDARNDTSLPPIDLIMASPECTHHSIARGGRPVSDQKRQQPFALLDWIDAKRPRWCLIENVREFRDWGPLRNDGTESKPKWHPDPKRKGETFKAWVRAIEALGYQVDHQLLNAADFGAPTKRVRLFVMARRGDSRRDMPWPEPTHAGRWVPAHTIIDWSRPCPSIFSRKRPLAEKTLRRIEIGLRKFVGEAAEPFMVTLRRNMDGRSVAEPLCTVTAGAEHHALAVPFQLKAMGRNPGVSKSIKDPLPTIVATRENHAVVMPFLSQFHNGPDGERRNYDARDPVPTLDTQNRYGVVAPYLVDIHHGNGEGRDGSVGAPLRTVVTKDGNSLVVPYLLDTNHGDSGGGRTADVRDPMGVVTAANGRALCLPFLTKYYGTGGAQAVTEPIDTITAKDRFGLAMVSLVKTMQELGVIDIGFRMLEPDELAAAQGFPAGYYLHGTKADQVRQVGNAVCPPVARALCDAIAEAA